MFNKHRRASTITTRTADTTLTLTTSAGDTPVDITKVTDLLDKHCRRLGYKRPKYTIVFVSDDKYQKVYTVRVEVKGVLSVADTGISRRMAEKKAAIKALVALNVFPKDIDDNEAEDDGNNNDNGIDSSLTSTPGPRRPLDTVDGQQNGPKAALDRDVLYSPVSPKANSIGVIPEPKVHNKPSVNDSRIKYIDDNNHGNHNNIVNNNLNQRITRVVTNAYDIDNPGNGFISQSTAPNNRRFNYNTYHKSTDSLVKNTTHSPAIAVGSTHTLPHGPGVPSGGTTSPLNGEENSITALIKYCIGRRIPLPFYDFNYTDGAFDTQCRVEFTGDVREGASGYTQEFVANGRSSTLKVAKIIASQKIIDELKKRGMYYKSTGAAAGGGYGGYGSRTASPLTLSPTLSSRSDTGGSQPSSVVKEYSTLTINMRSTPKLVAKTQAPVLAVSPPTVSPVAKASANTTVDDLTDDNDSDYGRNDSTGRWTLGSRDDNNNSNKIRVGSNYTNDGNGKHPAPLENKLTADYNVIIDDPVDYLRRYCQKNKLKGQPVYDQELRSGGKDRCPLYTFKCALTNREGHVVSGRGLGNTKKNAKRAAAEDVVRRLLATH